MHRFKNRKHHIVNIRKQMIKAISLMICLSLLLCFFTGCSEEKSGLTKVEEKPEVLLKNSIVEPQSEYSGNYIEGDMDENGDIHVDTKNVPVEIRSLLPLCEAIIIGQMDSGVTYDAESPYFIWHCVQVAFVNSGWGDKGAKVIGGKVVANSTVVKDYLLAMFGNIKDIPSIPEVLSQADENGDIQITFGNNMNYNFEISDMNVGNVEVKSIICHPDTTADVFLVLHDYAGYEIGGFLFKLRGNTRDTSRSAKFLYEIVDVVPNDEITKKRMEKEPYLTKLVNSYGANVRSGMEPFSSEALENPRANIIDEIIGFDCFGGGNEVVDEFSNRIQRELVDEVKEAECLWYEVRSYPHTNDKYLQVLATRVIQTGTPTAGMVFSYVYDINSRKEITKQDALSKAGFTEETLIDEVTSHMLFVDGAATLEEVNYTGFIINDDESIDFYLNLAFTENGRASHDIVVTYNTATENVLIFNEESGIVPEDFSKDEVIKLSHGR